MRIVEIIGSNMELTDPIKQYVEEKLGTVAKICERFDPCEITVDIGKTTNHHKNGPYFHAEFNLTIPGKMFRVVADREDLYEAIDEATDDLRRQVRRHKERLLDRRKGNQPPGEIPVESEEDFY